MSFYEEVINNIKSWSIGDNDSTLNWENHDMEYNHQLAGIEKSHIFNVDGAPSFDINKIEEMGDEELFEISKFFKEYDSDYRFRSRRYYSDNEDSPSFRYYIVGGNNPVPFASVNYFREVRNKVTSEMRDRMLKKRNRNATDLVPILEKFIERHRKNNPSLYPDWLTFNFYEVRYGDLIAQPVVDITKLLNSGDRLNIAKQTRGLLEIIWNRLLDSDRYRRYNVLDDQIQPKLRFTNVKFEDWNSYMKNVVNKEIKPAIKNIPRAKECVHSIIFRFRGGIDYIEIQIYPRFKKDCTEYYWSRFNTSDFKSSMSDVLLNYGWKKGINYSDSTWRD